MYTLFNDFLLSDNTLQVYQGSELLFSSNKDRLLPLLEYLDSLAPSQQHVIIFDKILGNAAALLCIEANCQEVHSPLGSQLAITTLEKYGVKYHITEIVPNIVQPNKEDMCPMEKLSIDKEPAEFYEVMKNKINSKEEIP